MLVKSRKEALKAGIAVKAYKLAVTSLVRTCGGSCGLHRDRRRVP